MKYWIFLLAAGVLYILLGRSKEEPKEQAKNYEDYSILSGTGSMYPLADGNVNLQGDAGAYNSV